LSSSRSEWIDEYSITEVAGRMQSFGRGEEEEENEIEEEKEEECYAWRL
jgi:transcription elongation factor Elf1